MTALVIVLLLALLVSGCGLVEEDPGPTYADFRIDEPFQQAVVDRYGLGPGVDGTPAPDEPVDLGRFTAVQAIEHLYDSSMRDGIVAQALAREAITRGQLESQRFTPEAIDEIIADLERGADQVSIETFLSLPDVVDLAAHLEDEMALIGVEAD